MSTHPALRFEAGGLERDDVAALLAEHLAEMRATSPAESVHALPVAALSAPSISFWTARDADDLVGCGALKDLGGAHAELKSMRTRAAARGRGVGEAMVRHLLAEAQRAGMRRVSLETGTQDHFAPARRLYARHGFTVCSPFGEYRLDPHSVFMTREV
ncbi:GNAT family N-acetyltransferase [Aeromicrobium alkaliterrae]|uniref:GNAT family N-acetyltransferase n=1 Tax=Aeromicrobium alkaliterrae TaxID=302168 RepID=A0ABP4WEA7_9ACTN